MTKNLIRTKPLPEDAMWLKDFTVGRTYPVKRKTKIEDEGSRYVTYVIDDDKGEECLVYSCSIFEGSDWEFAKK